MISRRTFTRLLAGTAAASTLDWPRTKSTLAFEASNAPSIPKPRDGEDVVEFVTRVRRRFDAKLYAQLLGAANEFKEGDATVGVAAADEASRRNARRLLSNTPVSSIDDRPLIRDELSALITGSVGSGRQESLHDQTLGELKQFLLTQSETAIQPVMPGLSSEVIGCVVKLMSNNELISVGQKIFNPLPGSRIGTKGYLGARIQPNSPTDNVDDIRWQVFDGWSYAVGDALLGTNPVSSAPESVAAIETTLKDLLTAFGIDGIMPHCVLSHIDVQAEVEERFPGSTALWFQSIAGTDSANATFDISVEKMQA